MASCSVIPRGVAAVITVNTIGSYTMIWKDSQMMIIQRQPIPLDVPMRPEQTKLVAAYNKETLGIIHSLVDYSKFGSMNWGYLVSSPKGNHRIIYRNRRLPPITYRTWAPFVDESEIDITHWIWFGTHFAMWRGRKVEVRMAWIEAGHHQVKWEMAVRERLVGLDVSNEVFAHIVRDGEVVGLLLERTEGRLADWGDRALIYAAVARMQARGLCFDFHNFDSGTIVITPNGKVRFIFLSGLRSVKQDDIEFMKENMDELDLALRRGPGPIATDSLINCDNFVHRCVVLPRHFDPERPILGVRGIFVQLRSHYIAPFDDEAFFSFIGEPKLKRKSRKRHSMARFIAPDSDGESPSGRTIPMHRQVIPPHRRHRNKSGTKLLLLHNEDSDTVEKS